MINEKIKQDLIQIDIRISEIIKKFGKMGVERPKDLTDQLDKLFHGHNECMKNLGISDSGASFKLFYHNKENIMF